MARETELKFLVDPEFEIPALDQGDAGVAAVAELPSQSLSAIYYDTDDLRLMRSGLTLRHRTGETGKPAWTLKLPVASDDATREELTYDAGPAEIPPDAQALVTAYTRGRALRPVTQLKTKRRRWSLQSQGGDQLAELVDDRVSVLNGAAIIDRFREIEVENQALEITNLRKIGRTMKKAGAGPADQTPKAARALGDRARQPPDVAEAAAPSPGDPASEAVKLALTSAAHRLVTHDPLARMGGDPEGVHQMRVAVRRLRSDLRTLAPLVDPVWSQELRAELRWLADVLGPARDTDVLVDRLRRSAADLGDVLAPFFEELEQWHTAAEATLKAGLNDSRYIALLDRLLVDAANPRCTLAAADPCRRVLPALVGESWRPLADKARALRPEAADLEFHAVRILAKRVRYAAELAAKCLPPDPSRDATRFARRAEEIQNILGEHQDAIIARRKLLEAASGRWEDGPFNFAVGRLVERESAAAERCRRQFFVSWRRFDQKGMRNWLNSRGRR